MKERKPYQFQLKDFCPIKGAINYCDRNQERSESFGVGLRRSFLTGYNSFLIGAPLFLTIFGAMKGIEALVK